jgi:U3 small nucleolar RNA-associated protein 18
LLSSTSGILAPSRRKSGAGVVLPAGTLAIERLRDANQAAQGSSCGEVKVVAFHPSERVPVLCVGTADRRVRLFNVGCPSVLCSFEMHVSGAQFFPFECFE